MEGVRAALGQHVDPQSLELLVAEISNRVSESVREHLDRKKDEEKEDNNIWATYEDSRICQPCLLFATSKERPSQLDKHYKKNFGFLEYR